jgi:histone acetyltransferase MYST4
MRMLEPVKGRKRKIDPAAPIIEQLFFGVHELNPWYSAPLPAELFEGPEPGRLWMCEYCLKYMRARQTAIRHARKCGGLPPGCEIYRKDNLSVWEVNGRFSREYCQRLCLLAKMFLDHKTLYYDVETFLFYVLVEWREVGLEIGEMPPRSKAMGHSFVGYFSKEKQSPSEYNLSCIMTLPHHQRRGMGAFLMDFSYLLTRKEGKTGTPEKPLSDLGLVGYVRYWEVVVSEILREVAITKGSRELSVEELMTRTGMTANDVFGTLEYLEAIVHTGRGFELCISKKVIALERKGRGPRADPAFLHWTPYTCIR